MSLINGMSGMMGGCGLWAGPCPTPEQSIVNSTDPFGDGSLIAKYLLDGDATDLCGNYDGTATDVTYESGKYGDAGRFSESSSKIETNLDISNLTAFSISFFAKLSDTQEDYSPILMQSETDTREGIRITHGDGVKHPNIWNAEKDADSEFSDASDWSDFIDKMTHYSFVVNGQNASFFINGEHKETVDIGGILKIQSVDIGYNYKANYSINGLIDQVEIYNRALNPQEVQMLYTQSKYNCDPIQAISGLVAHYPLDGTAEDLTGNYNGTENGPNYAESDIGVTGDFDSDSFTIDVPTISLSDFTVCGWVYLTDPENVSSELTTNNNVDNNGKALMGIIMRKDDITRIDMQYDGYTADFDILSSSYLNTWRFVLATRVGAEVELFIDGVSIDGKKTSTDHTYDITMLGREATGNIKNVRIYDRALTQAEIETIYNYEKITRNIVIDRGLVAYYPLKNSSEDHWVSQYDGTDNGDVSYDGQSASFDGDGDGIDLDTSICTIDSNGSYSLSIWVNTISDTYSQIVRFGKAGDHSIVALQVKDGDTKCNFAFEATDGDQVDVLDIPMNNGEWHHFVASIDLDIGICATTVDGVEFSNDTVGGTKIDDIEYCSFGFSTEDDNSYFNGNISNVRIYNRALSQEEITTIYETEKGEFI